MILTGRRTVAVGTLIAEHPPHESRRALLTHRAPPSGSGVEAMQRLRVSYHRRKEAVGHAGELSTVTTACWTILSSRHQTLSGRFEPSVFGM